MTDYKADGVLGSVNELQHYGKKGMRWGVRKGKGSPSARPASAAAARAGKQPKAAPKAAKVMSDQELKKIVARKQLEKQYNDLNPKKVNAGKEYAKKLLIDTGKQQASRVASKAGEILVTAILSGVAAKVGGAAAGKGAAQTASVLLKLAGK